MGSMSKQAEEGPVWGTNFLEPSLVRSFFLSAF